ncbi:MAG: hypothetical protein ACXADB_12400 [Candidatus Hermodarchaeia archaeon]|jgi:hypothetical protein
MAQSEMRNFNYGLALILLFLASCGGGATKNTPLPLSSPDVSDPTPTFDDLKGAQISYSVSGGFAGISESWSVDGGGRFLANDGSTYSVDKHQLSILFKAMDQIGFFELEYALDPFSSCADCFTYKLTVSYDGQYKEIAWRDGDPELPVILHEVQELVRSFYILDPPILDQ